MTSNDNVGAATGDLCSVPLSVYWWQLWDATPNYVMVRPRVSMLFNMLLKEFPVQGDSIGVRYFQSIIVFVLF